MDIQYNGANCISINTKNGLFVIDDNLKELGLKSVTKADTNALFTFLPKKEPQAKLVITNPGEYEVSEVSIFGISARAHMDEEGKESTTIYKFVYDDLRVLVTGHIHPDLTDNHMEEIGNIDVLIIPVGGNGYTLDPIGAQQVIKKLEPKVVIPTHFDDEGINYPVPQQPLTEFLKVMNVENKEVISKFKPKPADFIEGLNVVLLSR